MRDRILAIMVILLLASMPVLADEIEAVDVLETEQIISDTPSATPIPDVVPIEPDTPEKPAAPEKPDLDDAKGLRFQASYGDGGMPIPQLFQADYTRTICVVHGEKRSVATSGCSVTCLSMVIAYLHSDLRQTPEALFEEAVSLEMYSGNGLSKDALKTLAKRHGIDAEWEKMSAKKMLETLENGTPIIAHMGKGRFTDEGHYIVLRGVTRDGRVLVNDPASAERSEKTYRAGAILDEIKKNGLMVCVPHDGDVVGMLSVEARDGSLDAKTIVVPNIE